MPDSPETLVRSRFGDDARAELAAAIRDRLPDVDLRVAGSEAEDRDAVETAEIVVAPAFDADLLADADRLAWLQASSAGVDHYDGDALRRAGVTLTTASGVHAEPIAEQVLGYLLVFERNLHRGIRQQRAREWENYAGTELRGKTVGVVGLGAIGSRVADLASALGTTVVGTKRDPATAPDAADEVYGPDDLDAVLERADYLVVACPLTDETRGLIDAEAFATLPDSAVLVNVARGAIVDESALVTALRGDAIAGAALDVFEAEPLPESSPLWEMGNVVVTPHMAGSTPAYWGRLADLFADNYRRYVAGSPLRNVAVDGRP